MKKEIDEIENDLKIKNIILCPDVQIVSDKDETDSIGKQLSLEQIINKMKLKSDAWALLSFYLKCKNMR